MADATTPEKEPNAADEAVDMVVESAEPPAVDTKSSQKRHREEEEEEDDDYSHDGNAASKKQKLEDKQEEAEGNEEQEEAEGNEEEVEEEEEKPSGPVTLGYKTFESSVAMFDYFFKFLHTWPLDLDVNKYEYTILLELLKNGHPEPDEKIGVGIRAFQVRKHPMWQSRCFFLIRDDESVDDFSFRKCVDHILPLPEEMQLKPDADKQLGRSVKRKHRSSKPGGRGRGGTGR